MKAVVIGGAGYIGSVTARLLTEAGHEVHIIDDLSTGHESYIDNIPFTRVNILEEPKLLKVLSKLEPEVVLHFAAKIQVAESVQDPHSYFTNNTYGTMVLMNVLRQIGCKNIVFSSTAAVYGEPEHIPISEDDSKKPVNPYGLSKYMSEQILGSYGLTHDFNWTVFRYFNAAGAYKHIAMDYPVMTHLIPHAVEALIANRPFKMFGDDYDTPDGTCIRDFVHVADIARAHVIAAEKMIAGTKYKTAINLGSGHGYSVRDVLQMLEKISGRTIEYTVEPRRTGDPSKLIASCEKAKTLLGWQPQYSLEDMVESHFLWRQGKES